STSSSKLGLLAHELAHVMQQTEGPGQLQRKCGPGAMGPTPENCNLIGITPSTSPKGSRFLFNVNCDEFAPGEKKKLEALADPNVMPPGSEIEIVGMASADGDPKFNNSLSCHRAAAAVAVFQAKGLGGSIRSVQATGGVAGTEHDPRFRAVDVFIK